MSYIRGRDYTWTDGKNLHLPSDILSMDLFDELVVMRYEQMTQSVRIRSEKRAIKKHIGNLGCDELCKKHGKKTTIELMDSINKLDKDNKITIIKDTKKNNNG